MKIEKIYDRYWNAQKLFRCPICYSKMKLRRPASIVCKKEHCYDLSKEGYLNFLPHQKQTKYTKELFSGRRIILEQGYYKPLEDCLAAIVQSHFPKKKDLCMLDVGCGEGFYAGSMKDRFPQGDMFAFDNAKDAIRMGAKKRMDVRWFVGDLTNIPLASQSMDVIFDLFTPSNYGEFTRLLKADGILIKVIPGEHYLKELRDCITKEWKNEAYSIQPVADYFRAHMELLEERVIHYEMDVDEVMAKHFVEMTPMMFDAVAEDMPIHQMTHLTFEMMVLVGKAKQK